MGSDFTRKSLAQAKGRCTNPKDKDYGKYKGLLCDEWLDLFNFFRGVVAEIGPRPAGTSLDQIISMGGYRTGNVRWATRKEQARNRVQKGSQNKKASLAKKAGVRKSQTQTVKTYLANPTREQWHRAGVDPAFLEGQSLPYVKRALPVSPAPAISKFPSLFNTEPKRPRDPFYEDWGQYECWLLDIPVPAWVSERWAKENAQFQNLGETKAPASGCPACRATAAPREQSLSKSNHPLIALSYADHDRPMTPEEAADDLEARAGNGELSEYERAEWDCRDRPEHEQEAILAGF